MAGVLLEPVEAERHKPLRPSSPGPGVRCSCGAAMYASTEAELSALWIRHLLKSVGVVTP